MSGSKRKSDNWGFFEKQLDRQRPHHYWWVKCKACTEAYQNMGMEGFGAAAEPTAFVSRPEKLARHVQDCRHIAEILRKRRARHEQRQDAQEAAREQAARPLADQLDNEVLTDAHDDGQERSSARISTRRFYDTPIQTFLDRALSPHEVETFQRLLLELTVDANVPMAWVGRESFKAVIRFLRPSAEEHVPHRKKLGGPSYRSTRRLRRFPPPASDIYSCC